VIDSLPHLRPFLSSLHECRYAQFFQASTAPLQLVRWSLGLGLHDPQSGRMNWSQPRARQKGMPPGGPAGGAAHPAPPLPPPPRLQAFAGLTDAIRADVYLHPHFRYYMREVRVAAYAQVSMTLGGAGTGGAARGAWVAGPRGAARLASRLLRPPNALLLQPALPHDRPPARPTHRVLQPALPHDQPPAHPPAPQFLESYKSVTLASMAATFGVSPGFLDAELVGWGGGARGSLHCSMQPGLGEAGGGSGGCSQQLSGRFCCCPPSLCYLLPPDRRTSLWRAASPPRSTR
jgi:hypothetical protein